MRRIKKTSIFILLLLISCKAGRLKKDLTIADYGTPPNGIKLADNLFIDRTEVTNFAYLEFLYWNYKVFGKTEEYLKLLPDTGKWMDLGDFYDELPVFYFRHPEYRNHPVVNITREQALKFTKWRSDRVMEFLLMEYKVIDHTVQDRENYFTIEKYFNGHYRNVNPDRHIQYYPEYGLPDSMTYVKALRASDSMYVDREKYCKSKFCEDEIFTINCLQNIRDRNDSLLYGNDPVNSTQCKYCKTNFITHLQGNVSEFTDREEVLFGGSFKDNCDKVYATYFFTGDSSANCYTGFRNKCVWKKWEKKK